MPTQLLNQSRLSGVKWRRQCDGTDASNHVDSLHRVARSGSSCVGQTSTGLLVSLEDTFLTLYLERRKCLATSSSALSAGARPLWNSSNYICPSSLAALWVKSGHNSTWASSLDACKIESSASRLTWNARTVHVRFVARSPSKCSKRNRVANWSSWGGKQSSSSDYRAIEGRKKEQAASRAWKSQASLRAGTVGRKRGYLGADRSESHRWISCFRSNK